MIRPFLRGDLAKINHQKLDIKLPISPRPTPFVTAEYKIKINVRKDAATQKLGDQRL